MGARVFGYPVGWVSSDLVAGITLAAYGIPVPLAQSRRPCAQDPRHRLLPLYAGLWGSAPPCALVPSKRTRNPSAYGCSAHKPRGVAVSAIMHWQSEMFAHSTANGCVAARSRVRCSADIRSLCLITRHSLMGVLAALALTPRSAAALSGRKAERWRHA